MERHLELISNDFEMPLVLIDYKELIPKEHLLHECSFAFSN